MLNEGGRRCRQPRERTLQDQNTGLLRHSEDELLVVELGLTQQIFALQVEGTAKLCVLRLGRSDDKWELTREVLIFWDAKGSQGDELQWWRFPDRAIPVGGRFLCWINYTHGFLFVRRGGGKAPALLCTAARGALYQGKWRGKHEQ